MIVRIKKQKMSLRRTAAWMTYGKALEDPLAENRADVTPHPLIFKETPILQSRKRVIPFEQQGWDDVPLSRCESRHIKHISKSILMILIHKANFHEEDGVCD